MKLAAMQPYVFPYLGYFQLLQASDKFVCLDDVNFIKRGWINRNRLLIHGQEHLFSVPLKGASQNRLISEIDIDHESPWAAKLLKTVRHAYVGAPHFDKVYVLTERVITARDRTIAKLALRSIRAVAQYLEINTDIVETSSQYGNRHLRGAERVYDICRREGSETYLNPIGGLELYSRERFAAANVQLQFVKPGLARYPQPSSEFVPGLSILDMLMWTERDMVVRELENYQVV